MGFIGIQNFPTVGLIDSSSYFRHCLEQTDMGYAREVEMIAKARRFGLLTTPYVFSEEEAVAMIRAGADIIVIHLGLTVGAVKGAKSADLNESVKKIRSIIQVVRQEDERSIILVHGGPLDSMKACEFVLEKVGRKNLNGFYGASTFERTPPYEAIQNTVEKFRKLNLA